MENQVTEARYVLVEGQKVYLNQEQQKAWDSFVNKARNQAHRDGTCRQPNYHLCNGDCLICPWRGEGRFISLDDQNHGRGCGNERCISYSPSVSVPSPEDILLKSETISSTTEKLYAYANFLFERGAEILKLYADGNSFAEISRVTAIGESTIRYRVGRMLLLIRKNKKQFFD